MLQDEVRIFCANLREAVGEKRKLDENGSGKKQEGEVISHPC